MKNRHPLLNGRAWRFDFVFQNQWRTVPRTKNFEIQRTAKDAARLFSHGLSEIVPRFPISGFTADGVDDIPAEEERDVKQAEHNRDPRGRSADDEIIQVQRGIDQREIFHLDRQDHKQKHLLVGIQCGIGEEQRQIEERVIRIAGNQRGDDEPSMPTK